jgi:hypothetical protein
VPAREEEDEAASVYVPPRYIHKSSELSSLLACYPTKAKEGTDTYTHAHAETLLNNVDADSHPKALIPALEFRTWSDRNSILYFLPICAMPKESFQAALHVD